MGFTIRNAESGDYSGVKRIMDQVQQMHVDWRPDIYRHNDEFVSEEDFEQMVNSGDLYVAVESERIVGVLEIAYRHVETPAHVTRDVVFIDTMAVDSDYRGRGVGRLFFAKVKELKDAAGADGIELQVNAKNRDAYRFYRKHGFTEKSINMELL